MRRLSYPGADALFLSLLLILFATSTSAQDKASAQIIYVSATATEELIAQEGQKIIVYGDTSGSHKSVTGTNYVAFKDGAFSLITFKSDLHQFPEGEPVELYDNKRLAVEGTLSIFQGKPQIKLTSPTQITLLEEGTTFPPKTPPAPLATTASEGAKENSVKKPASEAQPEPEPVRKPPVDPSEYFKRK